MTSVLLINTTTFLKHILNARLCTVLHKEERLSAPSDFHPRRDHSELKMRPGLPLCFQTLPWWELCHHYASVGFQPA